MSFKALQITEDTVYKMLTAQVHVGTENLDSQMERYIWNRRADGQFIINLQYTWDKIVLAARIIAAVENPKDVAVISARDWGQRAVLKFAHYTQATPIAGRFTPGTFTNQQQQKDFKEPRLIIVTDTRIDHQPLLEASYVNIPTIAFANSDSPIQYVDVVIPCNNAAPQSIGLIYWLLCREVMRIKGQIPRNQEWETMPDLFFWRDPAKEEENKQEEQNSLEAAAQQQRNAQGNNNARGGADVNPFAALSGAQDTMRKGGQTQGTGASNDAWTEDNSAQGTTTTTTQRPAFAPWGANAGSAASAASAGGNQQQGGGGAAGARTQQSSAGSTGGNVSQGSAAATTSSSSDDPNAIWSSALGN